MGIFARNAEYWRGMLSFGGSVVRLSSENHVFEVLGDAKVNVLGVELASFDNTAWIGAMLDQAQSARIPVLFLLQEWPWVVRVMPDGTVLDRMQSQGSCTRVDLNRRQCFHKGMPIVLPWRVTQTLALLVSDPSRTWNVRAFNLAALENGWNPWTDNVLKVHVHHIRQSLGPEHIRRVSDGYQFSNC